MTIKSNKITSLTNSTVNSTVDGVRSPMNRTNANDFRANLKDWLEAAKDEPVKITRRNGESFILLTSEEFEALQLKIANLQGIAQGLSDALQGRTHKDSTGSAIERAKIKTLGKQKTK